MQPPQRQGSLNVQVVQCSPHLESIITVASFCMVKLEVVELFMFFSNCKGLRQIKYFFFQK